MKKLLFISAIAFFAISCEKNEHYAKFEHNNYSFHYNEGIQLTFSTSEKDLNSFYFLSEDTNVVKVDRKGYAEGVFVGKTTVSVTNGNTSGKCTVTIEPYEKLFIPWPINLKGFEKNEVEFIEVRDQKNGYQNTLSYLPLESETGIDSLKYSFNNDSLYEIAVYIKNNVPEENALLFLKERYAEKTDYYYDHNSQAIVTYERYTGDQPARFTYQFQ